MLLIRRDIYLEIDYAARQTGVDRELLAALAVVESGLNPLAVGDDGHSFGLLQLSDGGAGAGMDRCQLLDIPTNMSVGANYLAEMIRQAGSEPDGVSAYNQGLLGWHENGLIRNEYYVSLVLGIRDRIHEGGMGALGPQEYYRWQ